jgi:hypothetical protein
MREFDQPDMVGTVRTIYRRFKRLNCAYIDAEDKHETIAVLRAHVNELQAVHSLLPAELRPKSWLLTMERHIA